MLLLPLQGKLKSCLLHVRRRDRKKTLLQQHSGPGQGIRLGKNILCRYDESSNQPLRQKQKSLVPAK